MPDLALTDLLAEQGRVVPMPGASSDILSVLLHLDPVSRARSLVVQFPPGFCRPGAGRYDAGEEMLVLSGELQLGGVELTAGDWCWVPPGAVRVGFGSERGAIVYAWFSGGNDYVPVDAAQASPVMDLAPCRPADLPEGAVLRDGAGASGPGRSSVLVGGSTFNGPAEVYDLVTHRWSRREDGGSARVGRGPALVRWDVAHAGSPA